MNFPANQAGILEGFQVLGHGGVGDGELLGNIPGEAAALFFEKAKDEHASGVAQCFGVQGDFFFSICVWFFRWHILQLFTQGKAENVFEYAISENLPIAYFWRSYARRPQHWCVCFLMTKLLTKKNIKGWDIGKGILFNFAKTCLLYKYAFNIRRWSS